MGLLTRLLTAPMAAPITGPLWLARKIAEAAEAEHNNPATLRQALVEAETALLAGTLTEDEYDEIETDILLRLRRTGP
ncbi:MAG: gas vesicle protein GvpG [Pseudomonadota bacterium]